jgi:hypothetical protein
MTFILASDGRDDDVSRSFDRYRDYLERVRNSFPRSAYQLATSDWYFNPEDHLCPHDAWLDTFTLREPSTGTRSEVRTLSLSVRLLGAYHDRYIVLRYPRVFSYRIDIHDSKRGHRDWRYDELRLSDSGNLIHEIEWCGSCSTGSWIIEASDIEFAWLPRIRSPIRRLLRTFDWRS